MKYKFNFIQIANWVYVIRTRLKDFRARLDTEKVSKQEAIENLENQKRSLLIVINLLNKNANLLGIQKDFLRNLSDIKKQFGVEE
jgi:hypothetical protein